MILFIVEGRKMEPRLIEAMQRAFPDFKLSKKDIVYTYETDIYTLYRELKSFEENKEEINLLTLLQNRKKKDTADPIHTIGRSADVEQIYLFFDYDFHKRNTALPKLNQQISQLIKHFNNETEEGKGKLFISYPMVEALYHTPLVKENKGADTCNFMECCVEREQCKDYKRFIGTNFGATLEQVAPCNNPQNINTTLWKQLVQEHIKKAHFLCHQKICFPAQREDINQESIFEAQVKQHIETSSRVAVLSAFPLFLYDYFCEDRFL